MWLLTGYFVACSFGAGFEAISDCWVEVGGMDASVGDQVTKPLAVIHAYS
jgi:hypothetical protein